jgi:hypothetical protein
MYFLDCPKEARLSKMAKESSSIFFIFIFLWQEIPAAAGRPSIETLPEARAERQETRHLQTRVVVQFNDFLLQHSALGVRHSTLV